MRHILQAQDSGRVCHLALVIGALRHRPASVCSLRMPMIRETPLNMEPRSVLDTGGAALPNCQIFCEAFLQTAHRVFYLQNYLRCPLLRIALSQERFLR